MTMNTVSYLATMHKQGYILCISFISPLRCFPRWIRAYNQKRRTFEAFPLVFMQFPFLWRQCRIFITQIPTVQCLERSLLPQDKISSTTHVQRLHGKQQQRLMYIFSLRERRASVHCPLGRFNMKRLHNNKICSHIDINLRFTEEERKW